jgi:tRNA G18 (ribose-2'-O)-methylase SpoU
MNSFAIFRLPHERQGTLMLQTTGEPLQLRHPDELRHKQGFVMAPFMATSLPLLLIQPDTVATFSSAEELLRDTKRVVVLEDVMNPTNLGAIFRSAAAMGMDAVLLTPASTDPLYRRCIRVSMGTVFQIPWAWIGEELTDWPEKGMELLRAHGFRTAAMALREDSVGIDHPALLAEEKLAVILGTEGDGLADQTIADCDYTVRIPMAHGVDSLNVAAAGAVAFWQLGRSRS